MDEFASQPASEREIYFQEAAARLGLPPQMIEKDFWVCWTLKRVFTLDSLSGNLLFKGGTSLSKVYGLIRRFSEDIDLSIHRGSLGFEGEEDPANPDLSNKGRNRQIEALTMASQKEIRDRIHPDLEAVIRTELGAEEWNLSPDPSDPDEQSLSFEYPRTSLTPSPAAYLKPTVKIEFGARSDHWPAETRTVRSYLSEALPDALAKPDVAVNVMSSARTFWEKATILHQMAHLPQGKPFPARHSRHYCDLAAMIEAGIGNNAGEDDDLRAAVVAHKIAFYRAAWARYEEAVPGKLRLLPEESRLADLARDLDSMREMFFDDPPKLESVLGILRNWETGYNRTGAQ